MDLGALIESLLKVCEQDEEFLRRSSFVEGNVRLGIGSTGFVLRFSRGHIIGISGDDDPSVAWDYEIVGPETDWARIWKGEMDLTQAVQPKFASIMVRGNRVKYAADIGAVVQLTRLMCIAAAELGVDVKPTAPPPPRGKPNPWETRHEVLGRYVDVDGVRTYYESMGDKGPVTFLAMHPAGRDCRQWQQFGDVVAEAGQFVAVDLPGHGKSWPLMGGRCLTTMDEIASFTWAFHNAAGIGGPTIVLGCSMGGDLVFQLAAEHPNEVVALVSFQGADYTAGEPEAARVLMDHPMVNPAYHHMPRLISLIGHRTPLPQREYLQWETRCYSSVSIKADLTAFANFDFRSRMSEIHCPALLIRGKEDWAVNAEMVNETAGRLINARAVEVVMPEGVGHFSHLEQPEEHGALVLDFLRQHSIIDKAKKK